MALLGPPTPQLPWAADPPGRPLRPTAHTWLQSLHYKAGPIPGAPAENTVGYAYFSCCSPLDSHLAITQAGHQLQKRDGEGVAGRGADTQDDFKSQICAFMESSSVLGRGPCACQESQLQTTEPNLATFIRKGIYFQDILKLGNPGRIRKLGLEWGSVGDVTFWCHPPPPPGVLCPRIPSLSPTVRSAVVTSDWGSLVTCSLPSCYGGWESKALAGCSECRLFKK